MITRNGLHRRLVVALLAATTPWVVAAPAQGASILDTLQPLGIPGSAVKPTCASPFAPWDAADLRGIEVAMDPSSSDAAMPGGTDLMFAGLGMDLLPTATICSPTYGAVPGAFSGASAARLPRTRIGRGWREIGNTLAQPAPLRPGDRLVVPEVDDAAQLRVSVAAAAGSPAAPVNFTDLAPGPSTVTVSREQRGVVVRLTRGDGSVSEGVAQVPVVPALNPSISGTAKRWRLVTNQLPGTVVYAMEFLDEDTGVGVSAADGRTVTTIKRTGSLQRGRAVLILVTANRSAMRFAINSCEVVIRNRRPRAVGCDPFGLSEFFALAARAGERAGAPAERPLQALPASSVQAAAARANPKVPLVATPVPRSVGMVRTNDHGNLVPLAADVNGDGRADFWSDRFAYSLGVSALTQSAGTVYVSGPSGLQPHRVELSGPAAANFDESDDFDSELSAIDDVTGDGVGELIVDLNERHALIPGDRAWGEHTAPILAPDPADLDPGEYVLTPSSSSPGAPYAAFDDLTGDGRRELGATDDFGTWLSLSSSDLKGGQSLRLPSIARSVPAPTTLARTRLAEDTAPRFDPRGRVIAGQLIALTWPKLATRKDPTGSVTVAVRDALGRDVRPPATTSLPGNALLLDYDRRSGDALLLAVTPQCTGRRRFTVGDPACKQTVVRVRADGSVRQTLVLPRRISDTTAAQTARFLSDGPDADGDVEILLTEDGRSLSEIDSTATGSVSSRAFGRAAPKLFTKRRVGSDGLRFIAVVAPDGSRRVFTGLRSSAGARLSGAIPTEITWGR